MNSLYGGTKTEMQRLLKDASAITGEKYKMGNMADIVQAINAIQKKNGITGTTEAEARGTIQGSKMMLSAAWENVLTALAAPEDLDLSGAIASLTDSAKTYLNNLFPVVSKIMDGLGDFMSEVLPDVVEKIPEMIADFAPKLLKAGRKMVEGFGRGLKRAFQKVQWPTWDDVRNNVSKAWNSVKNGFDALGKLIFGENADGTTKWPTWDTIKETVSEIWEGVKTGFQELGKLFFGENADGTTNWPTAEDIFEKAKEIWNDVLEKAKSLVPLIFGENTAVSNALTNAITFVQDFGNWIMDNWEAVSTGVAAIGAAFGAWKLLTIVISLNPIKIALLAIAGLVGLIATNWETVKTKIAEFSTWFEGAKAGFMEWINTNFIDPIKDLISWAQSGINKLEELLGMNVPEPEPREKNGKLTDADVNEIMFHYNDRVKDDQGKYNNSNLNKSLEGSMKAAGFSAEEIQSTIETINSGKISPADMPTFLSSLQSAGTELEAVKDKGEEATSELTEGMTETKGVFEQVTEAVSALKETIDSLKNKTITITTKYVVIGAPSGGGGGGKGDQQQRYAGTTNLLKAKGDWSVPYDNFVALLHRGEMVLTKSQARKFREGGSGGIDTEGLVASIVAAVREGMAGATVNSYLDGRNVTQKVNRRNTNIEKAGRFRMA